MIPDEQLTDARQAIRQARSIAKRRLATRFGGHLLEHHALAIDTLANRWLATATERHREPDQQRLVLEEAAKEITTTAVALITAADRADALLRAE